MYLEDVASHVSTLLLYETPKLKNVTKCEMTQVILGALIRVITFCVGVTWVQRSCGKNLICAPAAGADATGFKLSCCASNSRAARARAVRLDPEWTPQVQDRRKTPALM